MKSTFCTLVLILSQQIIGSLAADPQVSITGTDESFVAQTAGESRSIIDNDDAKRFGLYPDSNCKSAVNQYFGKSPNDCYLHEPTPWQLYPSYGWQEVTSVYKPLSARFIEKTSEPVALITRSYTNDKDYPITVQLSLKQSVTDKVTHKKTYGNEFGAKASAKFSILVVEANVEMNYKHTWGTEETIEKSKTVEIADTVTAQIPPHSNLTFTMSSYNIKAIFEVTYSNSVEGYVAANYNPTYQGHHFWALNTRALGPSKNPQQLTENMTFDYYSKGFLAATKMDLKDKSAAPLSVPLSDIFNINELYAD